MFQFLNRPYPFSFQPSRRIKQIVPIGLCVFLFLILFKPFGLGSNPNYIMFAAYMTTSGAFAGLITTVLIPLVFPWYFNEDKWTLKRNLVWVACINLIFANIMFFALNIFLIYKYKNIQELSFKNYLWWAYLQLLIGVPLGVIINLVNQYYLLKKHLQIAANINNYFELENEPVSRNQLEFEVDKYTRVNIDINSLIYIEALGNYLNVTYKKNGIKKITIRETIYNIEQKTSSTNIIYKIHRSYLVNLRHIYHITGDAQGLKVHFKDIDNVIPVSRNKIKEFRRLTLSKMG
jgi:LytTr DNA-binding domain